MKAKDFLDRLEALKPTPNELNESGIPEESHAIFIDAYEASMNPNIQYHNDDPVLDLIENYDASKLEIGMVTFSEPRDLHENLLQIGRFEEDALCLNSNNGEVVVVDGNEPEHLMWKCSSNTDTFLSALICAASFLSGKLRQDSQFDQIAINDVVRECSVIAGGDTYIDFYKVLLASEE